MDHFRLLLEGIVATPDKPIRDLSFLTYGERHQLLVDWNSTYADYPKRTVAELFEEQVAKRPDAVAIVFGESRLSYGELNARANQLAHFLKSLEVQPNAIIGFCVERSVELIVTLLGILKAGCAYFAVDPTTPPKRLQFILEDARPAVIVVQSEQQEVVVNSVASAIKHPPIVVCLARHTNSICKESEANLSSEAIFESPAYVCFTSGSTGRPKGVRIPHRGVVRLVKNTNYISISSSDVFLQLAPIFFDASTFEIWGCLLNGARLVVSPAKWCLLRKLGQLFRIAKSRSFG